MARKMRSADEYLQHLYLHVNEMNQFVIFSGFTFQQFIASVGPLQNLLLLKNEYEDGSFNMHTRLEFVSDGEIQRFAKKVADSSKDLCWIDFFDEKKLNVLTPQEQAELLYIGHKKEPIRSPFYHQLQNRFVYLAAEEERTTKIYFRDLEDVEQLVTNLFNLVIQEKERLSSFWRRKAKDNVPSFTKEMINECSSYAKEGVLLSLYKGEKPKPTYVIELRNISDINFPDEIWDDLNTILKKKHDETIEVQ